MEPREVCVVINKRPAGCASGALFCTELINDGLGGQRLLDNVDLSLALPEDAQQVALLPGYQLVRTLGNRLLLCSAQVSATRHTPLRLIEELDNRCVQLLQVGTRVVIVLKAHDTYRLKTFNMAAVDERFNGLESLGVRMARCCSVSGKLFHKSTRATSADGNAADDSSSSSDDPFGSGDEDIETSTRRSQTSSTTSTTVRLVIAGKDFDVSGAERFAGWGLLMLEVDANNVLIDVAFRSAAVSFQSRVLIRSEEVLLWRDGDLASVRRLDLDLEGDVHCTLRCSKPVPLAASEAADVQQELQHEDEMPGDTIATSPRPDGDQRGASTDHRSLGDRSSNFVCEVDGRVLAFFRRLSKWPTGVCRTDFVVWRLDESDNGGLCWTEIATRHDAFLHSQATVCRAN